MPIKRSPKRMTRQKRMISKVTTTTTGRVASSSATESREAEIIRKFHKIQKGYSRLMNDVAKELNLVRGWIGSQAMSKRNDIRARLTSRLSRS